MQHALHQTNQRFQESDFYHGFKQGIPIALGYIPVSFTFGLVAVKGGLPAWVAVMISLTNLTSAGQFAGTSLIIGGAALAEITLTTFIINIRYLLMSLSLSQKIAHGMPFFKRCIMAFGITDETFAVASMRTHKITFLYMLGLISGPYLGWTLGTVLGALSCSVLPQALQNSMGIALYAMFIALVIPGTKKSRRTLIVTLLAIATSVLFTWAPYFANISKGWGIIIASVLACLVGAALFPRKDN